MLPAACIILLAASTAVAEPLDQRMRRLADQSGCTLCHADRPPAPAWSDIAARYRGQRGAEEKLVQVVSRGAGPDQRHWEDKTRFIAMPANPVEISDQDARRLVHWILQRQP